MTTTAPAASPLDPTFNPLDGRRIMPKPAWLARAEAWIARGITLHPHVLSLLKLLLLVPLALTLPRVGLMASTPGLLLPLLALFFTLDYLDGVVAREQGRDTPFGRVLDRLTDYPLLLLVAYSCCDALPLLPVVLKLSLDLVLLGLFVAGRGPVENRVRTTISSAALVSLLLVSQGWAAPLGLSHDLVAGLLWLNIAFCAVIIVIRLHLLKPRYIADLLSAGNLACGVASVAFALQGRFELCLGLLLAGGLLDGMDGMAARRFGGTSWGAYSDDVADAVSYGVAPGVALAVALGGGWLGWTAGAAHILLTVGRLVYFTLRKGSDDGEHFRGMPSTAGALLVLAALVAGGRHPALVGLMAGAAGALMVAFGARYRHPGRALTARPALLRYLPLALLPLVVGLALAGAAGAAVPLLLLTLGYGLYPGVAALVAEVRQVRQGAGRGRRAPPRP